MRALLLVLVAGLIGCDMEVPCDQDTVACVDTTGLFALDPSCPLSGPLLVTLGTGTSTFTELPPDQLPVIETGPQGGTHSFLAIRVENPVPSRLGTASEQLKADFLLAHEEPGPCTEQDGIVDGVNVDDGGQPLCAHRVTSRTVVFGARTPLHVVEGRVEETSVLFQWSQPSAGRWSMAVTVTDPCGRTGTDKSVVVLP